MLSSEFSKRAFATVICFALATWMLACARANAGIAAPSYTLHDSGVTPGYSSSQAVAINNSGEVVGSSTNSSTNGQSSSAALFDGDDIINLGAYLSGNSYATAINSSGQVVGYSQLGGAFLYNSPNVKPLNGLTNAFGINDSGQIVGSYVPSPGQFRAAYLYSNGVVQDISLPSTPQTTGGAINAGGQVLVDWSFTPAAVTFLYTNGTYRDVGGLGGQAGSSGNAINDSGQVVGGAWTSGGYPGTAYHAFLDNGTSVEDLGTLGGASSDALGINNAGEIVGDSETTNGGYSTDGFLYTNGTMYDLNNLVVGDAGYVITSAVAINASGQIAADAITPSGAEHAVLLTPYAVPLPSAGWATLTVVPLLWGLMGRWRRFSLR